MLGPLKSSSSSARLSCPGSSRIRMVRPGAGRGSGRRRATPRARRAGRTARVDGRQGGTPRRRAPSASSEMRPSSSVSPEPTSSPPRRSSTRTPRAGSPRPVSSTWVESETLTPRIFLAWTRCSRAISSSSARTRCPSFTTSSPATYRRSTRWGAEKTSPATLSTAPPSSRPSVRQTAMSARRPGSSEPMSVRLKIFRAAAGGESKRVADRHRLGPAAATRDEERLLDLEEEVAALVRR